MQFCGHLFFFYLRILSLKWLYIVKFKFRKAKGTAVDIPMNKSICFPLTKKIRNQLLACVLKPNEKSMVNYSGL